MTSDQIKATDVLEMSERQWLKEIAYQLALLNEKPSPRQPAEGNSRQFPAVGASLSPPKQQQVRR